MDPWYHVYVEGAEQTGSAKQKPGLSVIASVTIKVDPEEERACMLDFIERLVSAAKED